MEFDAGLRRKMHRLRNRPAHDTFAVGQGMKRGLVANNKTAFPSQAWKASCLAICRSHRSHPAPARTIALTSPTLGKPGAPRNSPGLPFRVFSLLHITRSPRSRRIARVNGAWHLHRADRWGGEIDPWRAAEFWQTLHGSWPAGVPNAAPYANSYPVQLPDGRFLVLPVRPLPMASTPLHLSLPIMPHLRWSKRWPRRWPILRAPAGPM